LCIHISIDVNSLFISHDILLLFTDYCVKYHMSQSNWTPRKDRKIPGLNLSCDIFAINFLVFKDID